MAKIKNAHAVQGRHIYARASYLYQAASYLSSQACEVQQSQSAPSDRGLEMDGCGKRALQNLSRQALVDMRAVCLKSQIRQTPVIKKTVCKFCDTLLVEGQTCVSVVENRSAGGRKPWADVMVIQCRTCGRAKRYPVSAQRQKRLPLREKQPRPAQDVKQDVVEEREVDMAEPISPT
ncbi:RNAse P Rpr2/Rpp21/SNM1 subunit domain-containing protein [Stachybotrys elegans]|uniref:RNAse P Rpr2/Rpp21/SNM1 subunit domain-containing protein n=1 Tax=Stachybotrys elegans TaxID=80388 RepID=A0A8K0SIR6_9HYPO|nr:RNAse P Rpr2/Rpp21/SNM1 subunit domain-containing protein [Stachybotrys elegans]